MKPARFEYIRPRSLREALDLLAQHGGDASILAGGQSLMPMLNLRMSQPAVLIDINVLPGLNVIEQRDSRIVIGGRARYADLLQSPVLAKANCLLLLALPFVAHAAIRNRGTLGGSLALADPAAEMPACAACLDAEIVAISARGERRIGAAHFFDGVYSTALEPDELIYRVCYPVLDQSWQVAFDEVARRRGDFALAALALAVRLDNDRITDCRIVFAGVEAFPRRMISVEDALVGSTVNDLCARVAAVDMLASSLLPLEGGEYPPAYRLHLARVLLLRVLNQVSARSA